MTYNGTRSIVKFIDKAYKKGVKFTKKATQELKKRYNE